MDSPKKTVVYRGIGTGTLLGVLFVTLRLCHVISWPWVWVVSPFWIPWAALALLFLGGGLFLLVCLLMAGLVDWLERSSTRRRR